MKIIGIAVGAVTGTLLLIFLVALHCRCQGWESMKRWKKCEVYKRNIEQAGCHIVR